MKVSYHAANFRLTHDFARLHHQSLKWLYDEESPPNVNHDPTKFGGHRHCSSGEIIVLVCHVILQGDVIKVSFDFIGRDHQSELTPPTFGNYSHSGSGVTMILVFHVIS